MWKTSEWIGKIVILINGGGGSMTTHWSFVVILSSIDQPLFFSHQSHRKLLASSLWYVAALLAGQSATGKSLKQMRQSINGEDSIPHQKTRKGNGSWPELARPQVDRPTQKVAKMVNLLSKTGVEAFLCTNPIWRKTLSIKPDGVDPGQCSWSILYNAHHHSGTSWIQDKRVNGREKKGALLLFFVTVAIWGFAGLNLQCVLNINNQCSEGG